MMELLENKLTNFIQGSQKAKWRPVSNHNINNFTEDDIKRITSNYGTPIGKGGFGHVYKGALDDGTPVAVKMLKNSICQSPKEGFARETIVHCQINHKNVVRLLGYCIEDNALMIVTEYVSRGNLGDLLHGSDDYISLDARLGMAIECADALGYMHSSMYQPIIHGDIKPDNILLDSELHVKLSDFGLSRLLSMDRTHQYTTNIAGSRGYMDPEYIETGILDPKSDVYSFGIVLLELVTRTKASESGFSTGLKRNFTYALKKGKQEARQMFDTQIANERNMTILDEIGTLAAECFSKDINERPEMKDVQGILQVLRKALHREQAQEKIGQGITHDTLQNVNKYGASVPSSSSTSTVTYKFSMLNIFNRRARRREFNNRNEGRGICIYTKRDIEKITGKYSKYSTVIAEGSLGRVYLGHTEDGTRVQVKALVTKDQGENFINAVAFLWQIRHYNITRFLGCCLETEIPLMVYELPARGSLYGILHGSEKCCLPLDLRLDIAIGSAEALAYLHSVTPMILHFNFKSANILLDDNLVPKVAGINLQGLSQHCAEGLPCVVTGDWECLDPIYFKTGRFTAKSDVYAFGVVLLELITRKRPRYGDNNDQSLPINYMKVWMQGNSGEAMFDEEIAVEGNNFVLEEVGKMALECLTLKEDADERPNMVEVVERLQKLKRHWKHGEGSCRTSDGAEEIASGF